MRNQNYLKLQFQNMVYKKDGIEYQAFFEDIMLKAFPYDFEKIRPYENMGDGGNDGYMPSRGTYYQVYAPMNPQEKELDTAKKT